MKRDETFRVQATCPAHDRAQKPVRVSREEPPKEAASRLSIRRCSRVRHPRSSSMLVTLDMLYIRNPSVRFALAVISSMCPFHLRSFEYHIPRYFV